MILWNSLALFRKCPADFQAVNSGGCKGKQNHQTHYFFDFLMQRKLFKQIFWNQLYFDPKSVSTIQIHST